MRPPTQEEWHDRSPTNRRKLLHGLRADTGSDNRQPVMQKQSYAYRSASAGRAVCGASAGRRGSASNTATTFWASSPRRFAKTRAFGTTQYGESASKGAKDLDRLCMVLAHASSKRYCAASAGSR